VKTPSRNADDMGHPAYPKQDRLADIKKKSQKNAAFSTAKPAENGQ
jgi:hypothetical protein